MTEKSESTRRQRQRAWCCQRSWMSYQPEQWCGRLGEKCTQCGLNLSHEKCVSLCRCYFFCHEKCFTRNFEEALFDEEVTIECDKCGWELGFTFNVDFKYGPAIDKWKALRVVGLLLLCALFVVGIIATMHSQIRVEIVFFIIYVQALMLALVLYVLGLRLRQIIYKKIVKIKEVVSTKMEIQTSAFKDLQMETNEELTKDYLMTKKI